MLKGTAHEIRLNNLAAGAAASMTGYIYAKRAALSEGLRVAFEVCPNFRALALWVEYVGDEMEHDMIVNGMANGGQRITMVGQFEPVPGEGDWEDVTLHVVDPRGYDEHDDEDGNSIDEEDAKPLPAFVTTEMLQLVHDAFSLSGWYAIDAHDLAILRICHSGDARDIERYSWTGIVHEGK